MAKIVLIQARDPRTATPEPTGFGLWIPEIDECHEKSDNCNLYAECINHEGTFDCECLPGFDGDGVICNDIDECENAMSLANANGCPYNNQCRVVK